MFPVKTFIVLLLTITSIEHVQSGGGSGAFVNDFESEIWSINEKVTITLNATNEVFINALSEISDILDGDDFFTKLLQIFKPYPVIPEIVHLPLVDENTFCKSVREVLAIATVRHSLYDQLSDELANQLHQNELIAKFTYWKVKLMEKSENLSLDVTQIISNIDNIIQQNSQFIDTIEGAKSELNEIMNNLRTIFIEACS